MYDNTMYKNDFSSIVTVRWCFNRLHNFALLNFVYRRLKKAHLTCTKFDESKVVEHCQTNIWRLCIFMCWSKDLLNNMIWCHINTTVCMTIQCLKNYFSLIVTVRYCCNCLHDLALQILFIVDILLSLIISKIWSNLCCTGKKNLNFEKSSYVYKLDSLYTTVYITKMFFMVNVANFLCLKRPS